MIESLCLTIEINSLCVSHSPCTSQLKVRLCEIGEEQAALGQTEVFRPGQRTPAPCWLGERVVLRALCKLKVAVLIRS